jgi:hypothetical protein
LRLGAKETLLTSRTNHYRESLKLQILINPIYIVGDRRLLNRSWNGHIVKSRDVFAHQFGAQVGREVA